jgi:pimeloyl-ACP methyl ester carboxylesterase
MNHLPAESFILPDIQVARESSQIDAPLHITLVGLQPGETVVVRATIKDEADVTWAAQAAFVTTPDGFVDLDTQAPKAGSYDVADSAGLLWSMRPVDHRRPTFFDHRIPTPIEVTFVAEIAGAPVASRMIKMAFAEEDIVRRPVVEAGLFGRLYHPESGGPHPGVLLLGGSDAWALDPAAALLASHGYAVLFLAYFGVKDLPRALHHIDLEYFGRALDWMARQPQIDATRTAVVGLSRGAELALELGVRYQQIRAVVAGSPSSVRHAGIDETYSDFTMPAWLYEGAPLPYVSGGFTIRNIVEFSIALALRRPMRQTRMFRRAVRNQKGKESTTIKVESIDGPVMLIAGTDDQLWPSDEFAAQIMERLRSHDHPYPDECLLYRDAGHFACFPYAIPQMPTMTRTSPTSRLIMDFGGTPLANGRAARESWPEILRFLGSALHRTEETQDVAHP